MPPVTIDPNTGKASIEINVKGNEGRVIGKGGETIRHMERKFNCKIEMRRDRGTCLVTGPENVMRDAAEYIAQVIENGDVSKNERAVVTNTGYVGPETPASMIAKIVADARAKIDSGEDAAASDFPDVLKGSDVDEPVAIEVPCPGQEGRVIGRGGATIKEIERQSGAVAKVSKVSLFWLFWQFLAIFWQFLAMVCMGNCIDGVFCVQVKRDREPGGARGRKWRSAWLDRWTGAGRWVTAWFPRASRWRGGC